MDAERAAELRAEIAKLRAWSAEQRARGYEPSSNDEAVSLGLDDLEALLPPPPPWRDPATCTHEGFIGAINVNFLADVGVHSANITIACAQCGLPFSFKGVKFGWTPEHPTVNVDATEMRAPIEPGPAPVPLGGMRAVFVVPQKPRES